MPDAPTGSAPPPVIRVSQKPSLMGDGTSSVAFASSGRVLAATGVPGRKITIWDIAAKRKITTLSPPANTDDRAAMDPDGLSVGSRTRFAPDGNTLFVWGDDGVAAWDLTTRKRRPFEAKQDEIISLLAVAPSGELVAGVGSREIVAFWQV